MRLTDEQVREIASRWESGPSSLGSVENLAQQDVVALLADREALLAENVKLRRVVEAAKALEIKPYPAHGSGWIMAIAGPPKGLTALDEAISALEATNVPGATDDKG